MKNIAEPGMLVSVKNFNFLQHPCLVIGRKQLSNVDDCFEYLQEVDYDQAMELIRIAQEHEGYYHVYWFLTPSGIEREVIGDWEN